MYDASLDIGHRCVSRQLDYIYICIYISYQPDLMVHVMADVPGSTVHMVHIPETGIFGQGQKQEHAPRY